MLTALTATGCRAAAHMVGQVDNDGSRELSFAEFADLLTARNPTRASAMIVQRCTELKQLFNLFDSVRTACCAYCLLCALCFVLCMLHASRCCCLLRLRAAAVCAAACAACCVLQMSLLLWVL